MLSVLLHHDRHAGALFAFYGEDELSCIEMKRLRIHGEDHPILATEQNALSSLTSVTLQNSTLAIWMVRKCPQIIRNFPHLFSREHAKKLLKFAQTITLILLLASLN